MKGDEQGPVRDDELDGLFACLWRETSRPIGAVGLAVSGGGDSMALLHLFSRWRAGHAAEAPHGVVITVDHQLRTEARSEIAGVATAAAAAGLGHAILVWTGDKPVQGLQEAARAARYRLFRAQAEIGALDAVLTAHTLDDQAETVLMRLARGSGLDGLAGMATDAVVEGVRVIRPLLGVPHARLLATLEAAGLTWFEDRTNHDLRFERVRLRARVSELTALGLTPSVLARSAMRLGRARAALDQWAMRCLEDPEVVHLGSTGFARVDWHRALDVPLEVRIRVMRKLIAEIGRDTEPVSLGKLEDWLASTRRHDDGPAAVTLARCHVYSVGGRWVEVVREPGRSRPGDVVLAPGEVAVWDQRFEVGNGARTGPSMLVAQISPSELKYVRQQECAVGERSPRKCPEMNQPCERAERSLPAFFVAGRLVSVPSLDYAEPEGFGAQARWLGRVGARASD